MIDLSQLLVETTVSPPCGDELTYDADFLALENAAQGKPEQQYGDTVIPAEPPEWPDVERRSLALLSRTKDVRVAGLLCRAWVNQRGFQGLADGTSLIAELLERYWDQVHPLPEDDDYFMRMNAVSILNDLSGLLRELRHTDFIKSSFGVISVRDAECLARGQPAEGHTQLTSDQLRVGIADAKARDDASLLGLIHTNDALSKIISICSDKLPGYQQPDLSNLKSLLTLLKDLLPRAQAAPTEAGTESATDGGPSDQAPSGPGVLRTRDDAVAQLLNVAEFLERTEPTNPAPLLIRRAAKLMRMGFMDILRELTPQSLSQVETITGTQSES